LTSKTPRESFFTNKRIVFSHTGKLAIVAGGNGSRRRAAVGAAPLTPSWHAERTPDAPAIIMGATGETVSLVN